MSDVPPKRLGDSGPAAIFQDRRNEPRPGTLSDLDLEPYQIYGGLFPTYWIFCNNCGFIAQFLKSVVDGEPEPGEPEPNR